MVLAPLSTATTQGHCRRWGAAGTELIVPICAPNVEAVTSKMHRAPILTVTLVLSLLWCHCETWQCQDSRAPCQQLCSALLSLSRLHL